MNYLWGAILDIITNFYNICSTSNLPAKLYIEYSHCYFFLPNSIYICYVLQKSFLRSHTVWWTLRTVWYGAPRAGFSKIDLRPLSASDTASDRGKNGNFFEKRWQVLPVKLDHYKKTLTKVTCSLLSNQCLKLDYIATICSCWMLHFVWIITALSLVYSLHYLISRYFVDIVTIKDKLMTEMKTDFNNCLSMVNKLPVL